MEVRCRSEQCSAGGLEVDKVQPQAVRREETPSCSDPEPELPVRGMHVGHCPRRGPWLQRSSSQLGLGAWPLHRKRLGADRSLSARSLFSTANFFGRSGWRLVFRGGFSGPVGSSVEQSKWRLDVGPGRRFGNDQIELSTASVKNVYLEGNGTLAIRALESSSGIWTSGRIETRERFSAPPGRELLATAEIEQPSPRHELGYWPAFWLLGSGPWPEHGEIDILEDVNGLGSASETLHCGVDPGGPCHEPDGITSGLHSVPGSETSFLRYSVVVDRSVAGHARIDWFIGQKQVFQVREAQVSRAVWREAVDGSFTVILDLAVGGRHPDGIAHQRTPTSNTSSGGRLQVRKLRVYVLPHA